MKYYKVTYMKSVVLITPIKKIATDYVKKMESISDKYSIDIIDRNIYYLQDLD